MDDIRVIVVVSGFMIVALIGAAIGAYIEREKRPAPNWGECRYWIKGDGEGLPNIPLPYGWTLTDALFLKSLLIKYYRVGCVLLYGSEDTGVSEV